MPLSLFSSPVYAGLFCDADLAAHLNDTADLAYMIAFERALAKVQGKLGLIPQTAADEIETGLQEARVAPEALAAGTAFAGVPVPALVSELRRHVGSEAGRWLHWGATSQDVIDTAQTLQIRACLDLIGPRLTALIDTLDRESQSQAEQLLAGRTRSQVSTPITLGYRIAQWAHPLIDAEAALPELRRTVLRLQFGGASGINSAISPDGARVAGALAQELDLEYGPSWHVNRTPRIALASWLVSVCAGLAKMAGDLILMGRSDIGELSSGTGGGSSTMPQKANPVQSETLKVLFQIALSAQTSLAAAAAPSEERDGASWPLEWMAVPQILLATGTALRHGQDLAGSLRPDAGKLSATIADNPEMMAEAASFALALAGVSKSEAKDLVAKAAAGPAPFAETLSALAPAGVNWASVLDPHSAIAEAKAMTARIFAQRSRLLA